jgi:pyruvate-ferredoxin/flavodoxin oxidoreductase
VTATTERPPIVSDEAPDLVKKVTALMLAGKGDLLPVSAFPPDGTWPTATTQWEKRNIAIDIPVWDEDLCIQCNKCALVCPHAAIRAKVYEPDQLSGAPETFKSVDYKAKDFEGKKYTIQVAPEDCTGCDPVRAGLPGQGQEQPQAQGDQHGAADAPARARAANYEFFLDLPEVDRTAVKADVKGSQFLQPLFEYSGACEGCGETPYVKLLTQLFGDRTLIANATGCSSIYGGNLPTTPYAKDANGRGPAWSNSLFEDNAEFGFGFRLAVDQQRLYATQLVKELAEPIGDELVDGLIDADQEDEAGIAAQRERVEALRSKLAGIDDPRAKILDGIADYLVKKSVWAVGGDGWAYDIGYGGLDHVLAIGPQRQPPGARHRRVLQHRRPGLQGHPAGGGGQVRHERQGDRQEGPRHDGHGLRPRLRRPDRLRRQGQPDGRAFMEADSYAGPSLIIAYSTASPTATTWPTVSTTSRWRWTQGSGPCIASTRAAPWWVRTH